MTRSLVVLGLLLVTAPPGRSLSAEPMLPAKRQALLLLKVLSYDTTLSKRLEGPLRIAVLFAEDSDDSLEVAKEMWKAFSSLDKLTIHNKRIAAHLIRYDSPKALDHQVAQKKINTLYLAPGLEHDLTVILRITRSARINLMAGTRPYIEGGVPMGTVLSESRPRILLNLKSAVAHGNEFSSQLFKVAEIVGGR